MQQLLALAACVYLVVFALTIYFTRAAARRVLGAAAGGGAVAVVGFGVELLCQALGFWHYPSDNTGRGPLLMYPVLVLMFAVLRSSAGGSCGGSGGAARWRSWPSSPCWAPSGTTSRPGRRWG